MPTVGSPCERLTQSRFTPLFGEPRWRDYRGPGGIKGLGEGPIDDLMVARRGADFRSV